MPTCCCTPSPTPCWVLRRWATSVGHFPDTDERFKGADSSVLLKEAARRVREVGFEIGNVDSTVVAQAPRLAPHIAAMVEGIARTLGVAVGQVNVKAKTAEKIGPVGQGLSIEARAVAMLFKPD